ncbi:MAG: hypothetical protein QXW13_02200 [Nanopusillaceae archaeon]
MGVDRAVVIIILTFVGLIIMLIIIFYFYGASVKRVDILNTSKRLEEVLSISLPTILCSNLKKSLRNKRTNTLSFFVFLILAIMTIIAMIMIYYLIYRGIMVHKVEDKMEDILNKSIK